MKKYKSIRLAQKRAKKAFLKEVSEVLEIIREQEQEEYIKSLEKLLVEFITDLKHIRGLTNV